MQVSARFLVPASDGLIGRCPFVQGCTMSSPSGWGVAPALEVRALAIRDAALVRVADADATI